MNWWTIFSSWQDFKGLPRTETKLTIHEIVKNFTKGLEDMKDTDAYIENIDDNGNLETGLSENNDFIFQSFTTRARSKRIRRLTDIAAYNA